MPISDRRNEGFVKGYILSRATPTTKLLDVGPGVGLNYQMLKDDIAIIDGVEVFEPYVEKYKLREKYNHVYVQNVVDFDKFSDYDLVLMGDVLEHLSVEDAVSVLVNMINAGTHAIIQVPYQYVQGIVENNLHEIHIQDDLTAEIMEERYGQYLKRIHLNGFMAVYVTRSQD